MAVRKCMDCLQLWLEPADGETKFMGAIWPVYNDRDCPYCHSTNTVPHGGDNHEAVQAQEAPDLPAG